MKIKNRLENTAKQGILLVEMTEWRIKMNALDFEYLKNNGFKQEGTNRVSSKVISDREFVNDGFRDEKQLAFIRTQFADGIGKYIVDMKIVVEFVNDLECDVSVEWQYENGYGDIVGESSTIGGEDVYDLVSQAIVTARVGNLK
jgi:hypothetical protein